MKALPMATVLSNRELHDNVPGTSSSSSLLPLLELGRDRGVGEVENSMIRTAGMLNRTSIASGLDGGCWCMDVEAERLDTGVEGLEKAIGDFWPI